MLKLLENNGTKEVGLVTPTIDAVCRVWGNGGFSRNGPSKYILRIFDNKLI